MVISHSLLSLHCIQLTLAEPQQGRDRNVDAKLRRRKGCLTDGIDCQLLLLMLLLLRRRCSAATRAPVRGAVSRKRAQMQNGNRRLRTGRHG